MHWGKCVCVVCARTFSSTFVGGSVCVCVCVCERERERERGGEMGLNSSDFFGGSAFSLFRNPKLIF